MELLAVDFAVNYIIVNLDQGHETDQSPAVFPPLYWREVKTPAHPRHCRDTSQVKPRHLSPAIPGPGRAGDTNDWCITYDLFTPYLSQALTLHPERKFKMTAGFYHDFLFVSKDPL